MSWFFEGYQTYVQVCFCSKTVRLPPEFLFRLAPLGTFSPGEGLRLRRCKQQFILQKVLPDGVRWPYYNFLGGK